MNVLVSTNITMWNCVRSPILCLHVLNNGLMYYKLVHISIVCWCGLVWQIVCIFISLVTIYGNIQGICDWFTDLKVWIKRYILFCENCELYRSVIAFGVLPSLSPSMKTWGHRRIRFPYYCPFVQAWNPFTRKELAMRSLTISCR